MKWCDPCAADPLSNDELRHLGVFWADGAGGRPPNVFLTRLHVRYDNAHFPEDLVFQETADRTNFQGRYVLRHAWTGDDSCAAAAAYRRAVRGAARTGSRAARVADRLERGRTSARRWGSTRAGGPGARPMVGAAVEELTRRRSRLRIGHVM